MLTSRLVRSAPLRIALALPLCATAVTAQPPTRSAVIEGLRAQLEADVAADNVGSIAAAIVIGDSIVWSQGFGWADRDKRVPAGANTLYRIGSISKTFTAVVLAQLVDRKIIALDDPVERFLPEVRGLGNPRPGAKPITFRQLASHTAGIIREPRLEGAARGPIAEWESKVLASIPATSFDTLPGARYAYSNIGYGILGLALSRAARVPFMTLVEDGIFKPLGMTSSTFIVTESMRPSLSAGYANGSNGVIDADGPAAEHAGRGYKVPNGGVYASVTDMARFTAALTGAHRPVMSDSMRRAMLTKQTPEPGASGYGLGLQLTSPNGGVLVASHGGSVAGYTCSFAFDPASKIGVILLRNYGQGRTRLGPVAAETVRALTASTSRQGSKVQVR